MHNLSMYGLLQNPGLHICLGLNANHVFASKTVFYTKSWCKQKPCYKHHVLHKHHVLAGPVQALFAACRIALSMVAGGTRRRRLNNGQQESTLARKYYHIYIYEYNFSHVAIADNYTVPVPVVPHKAVAEVSKIGNL